MLKKFTMALLIALAAAPAATAQETTQQQIDRLQKDLADLRAEIDRLRVQIFNSKLAEAETKSQLLGYEKRLARLEGAEGRRPFYFDPAARTGTIKLVNELAVPATVVVGERSYVLPAFGEKTLDAQPAGALTYAVTADGYGVSAPRRTTLDPSQTLTLTVTRPR